MIFTLQRMCLFMLHQKELVLQKSRDRVTHVSRMWLELNTLLFITFSFMQDCFPNCLVDLGWFTSKQLLQSRRDDG